jgi:hypothetical protein
MTKVAEDLGISDVALKKICDKHLVPAMRLSTDLFLNAGFDPATRQASVNARGRYTANLWQLSHSLYFTTALLAAKMLPVVTCPKSSGEAVGGAGSD